MKISVYTFVKNGLDLDFHAVEMIKQHIPYVDEIIVSEGESTDGTYEAIKDLDPKVKIFRQAWDPLTSFVNYVEATRVRCTGDWCIKLDCDEFIPEWEWEGLRTRLAETKHDIHPLHFINFYGNYKVYHKDPRKVHWPMRKWAVHRNQDNMRCWGDGSNVAIQGDEGSMPDTPVIAECHHFGFVRDAARLREKWRTQRLRGQLTAGKSGRPAFFRRMPSFLFDLMPHKWLDPAFVDELAIYEGEHIQMVRDNPDEFVRDKFAVYDYLVKKSKGASVSAPA